MTRQPLASPTAGNRGSSRTMAGAALAGSTASRHEYVFAAAQIGVTVLLFRAARQTQALDRAGPFLRAHVHRTTPNTGATLAGTSSCG